MRGCATDDVRHMTGNDGERTTTTYKGRYQAPSAL